MVDKTLTFVFGHTDFKTVGVGRTDAKVSAVNYPLQIFNNEILDADTFIQSFNRNAPNDIKALNIETSEVKFNIIQAEKIKTYHYYFNFGEKQHPFLAPLIYCFNEDLDIETMKKAAKLFEGTHYFHKYCSQPKEKTIFKRKIEYCEIEENKIIESSFQQSNSYLLIVKGKGFLRYQIRYMMAVLYEVGKETMTLDDVKTSLKESAEKKAWPFIAPSSGLQLYDVSFLEPIK